MLSFVFIFYHVPVCPSHKTQVFLQYVLTLALLQPQFFCQYEQWGESSEHSNTVEMYRIML